MSMVGGGTELLSQRFGAGASEMMDHYREGGAFRLSCWITSERGKQGKLNC